MYVMNVYEKYEVFACFFVLKIVFGVQRGVSLLDFLYIVKLARYRSRRKATEDTVKNALVNFTNSTPEAVVTETGCMERCPQHWVEAIEPSRNHW